MCSLRLAILGEISQSLPLQSLPMRYRNADPDRQTDRKRDQYMDRLKGEEYYGEKMKEWGQGNNEGDDKEDQLEEWWRNEQFTSDYIRFESIKLHQISTPNTIRWDQIK